MRFLGVQLFLAIAIASARDNSPPSPDRPWLPANLPKYEGELAGQRFRTAEAGSEIPINPRKVYGLAELIDIAQRNNPETRVAWEHARQGPGERHAAILSTSGRGRL